MTTAVWLPRSRLALSAIASNTGCTSDGELAITFKISAVAVCRSSASLVSLNSRTFSMAMTAWSAKVCNNSTSLAANAPASLRDTVITPIGLPLWSMGTDNAARNPRRRARSRFCGLGSTRASETLIADRSKMQRPANTAASGRIGYWFRRNCSVSGRAPRAAPKCNSSPSKLVTKTDHASGRLIVRSATASSTGCTSSGEPAMTFNISAVASCCLRASFRSLLGSEIERRLTRVPQQFSRPKIDEV